jgi:azurin
MVNVWIAAALVGLTLQTPAATARTIEIIGTDNMKFSVARIDAKPGETLRVVLKTQSTMPKAVMAHNFVVLAKGVNAAKFNDAAAQHRANDFLPPDRQKEIVAATKLAGAGETVEVTFTVPRQPGNYDYICTFLGHFKMGMRGVLAVK